MTRIPFTPRHGQVVLAYAVLLCLLTVSTDAWATTGGSMPWSAGMTQLGTDARGPLAFVFIMLAAVGGVVEYAWGGQLSGLLTGVGRLCLGLGVLGGLVTLGSLFGLTGAVI